MSYIIGMVLYVVWMVAMFNHYMKELNDVTKDKK